MKSEKSKDRMAARQNGLAGARKRWGYGHGKTVTVRAFRDMVNLLQFEVPGVERAQFVTDALEGALRKRLAEEGHDFDLMFGAAQL